MGSTQSHVNTRPAPGTPPIAGSREGISVEFLENFEFSPISEEDHRLILRSLLGRMNDRPRIAHEIEVIYSRGERVDPSQIDRIEVCIFSDIGRNKRVYLIVPHGRFKPIPDEEVIPLHIDEISHVGIVEGYLSRIDFERREVALAMSGAARPMLLKVFRSPATLPPEEIEEYFPMTEHMAVRVRAAEKTLQRRGKYPFAGELMELSDDVSRTRRWVGFQGLIPGLSLREKFLDYAARQAIGEFSAEELQERISILKIMAVSGYLRMWEILDGAYIEDPTPNNILIEGSRETGYFPIFVDIDRLTQPGRPLLEIMEKLRRSGALVGSTENLFSGYLTTFVGTTYDNPQEALHALKAEFKTTAPQARYATLWKDLAEFERDFPSRGRILLWRHGLAGELDDGKYSSA